jgi:hypothetical protein
MVTQQSKHQASIIEIHERRHVATLEYDSTHGPMITLTPHQKRQFAVYRRVRQIGGSLSREIQRVQVAFLRTMPKTDDYTTLQRWAEQAKPVGEYLKRHIPALMKTHLTELAKRQNMHTLRMLARKVPRRESFIEIGELIIRAMTERELELLCLPAVDALTRLIDPDSLMSSVFYAISQGRTTMEIASDLRHRFSIMRTDAKRISRTFGLHISTESQLAASESIPGQVIGYEVNAVDGGHSPTSREDHKERHGRRYYRNPAAGQFGMDEMPRPPIDPDGKTAYNCLLPGTIVQGTFFAGMKCLYSGKVFEFTCRRGSVLRVTANHPILTEHGFVPACMVKITDKIVSHIGNIHVSGTQHKNHTPTTVEDVFGAIKKCGAPIITRPAIAQEFYGDGKFMSGDVNIVRTNRILSGTHNAHCTQSPVQSVFTNTCLDALGKNSDATPDFCRNAVNLPTSRDVSRNNLFHSGNAISGFPFELFSIGSASQINTSRYKNLVQTTSGLVAGIGVPSTDAEFLRELIHRNAGQVAFNDLASINTFNFSGHVYDLQSPYGWIVSDNIYTSNCRCFLVPLIAGVDV